MTEVAGNTLVDGRYRILRRIGSGGMADVYCAEDSHLGRQVAIKVLHRRFAQDQEFVERFRREAKSAAGLNHPNVVGVFDRGEHEGTYYIAMEFLTGRTLKDIVTAEAPLPQERVIDLGTQILEAAGFAHRHGVIHRDFKPHNVIVDELGHAKVTDFGIARAGASEMTETGSIMGTAQYLSPEQAQGHAVTATSDIYSIGVMLYEMLAGRLPVRGRQRRGRGAQAPLGAAAADLAVAPGRAPGAGGGRDGRAREGPGPALAVRRGPRRGARGGPRPDRGRRTTAARTPRRSRRSRCPPTTPRPRRRLRVRRSPCSRRSRTRAGTRRSGAGRGSRSGS